MVGVVVVYRLLWLRRCQGIHDSQMGFQKVGLVMVLVSGQEEVDLGNVGCAPLFRLILARLQALISWMSILGGAAAGCIVGFCRTEL